MTAILDFPLEIRSLNGGIGEFEGYASVFNTVDSYGTEMARGAFKDSLEAWQSKEKFPALLWQHKADEPIGVYTDMYEDGDGLYVKGKLLTADDQLARRAYAHLKAGSINGLSVGFITEAEEYDERRQVTKLTKVNLMEVSLVTFPSNQDALITDVREALSKGDIPSPKQVEKILRDAGFSRSQAKTILSRGFDALTLRDADQEADLTKLSDLINSWSFTNEHSKSI